MDTLQIIFSAVTALIATIGGGVSLFFYKETKAQKLQDVRHAKIDNVSKLNDEWQELADYYKSELDKAHAELAELKAEKEELKSENGLLKLHNQALAFHKCTRNGCTHREPPRDYAKEI